jgi:hypothetical protein
MSKNAFERSLFFGSEEYYAKIMEIFQKLSKK